MIAVDSGSATLKDAINEAFRDWVTNVDHTFYLFGTVGGPHPFPVIVRDFQRIIGLEARAQVLELTGRLPDAVAACVGGGSNAIGIFHAFLDDPGVRLVGMEAGGDGIETGRHASTISGGTVGVLHGARSFLLQDEDGQIIESHSISRRTGLPGRRTGALAPGRDRPRRVPLDHRHRRRWTRSPCCPGPRASSRRSSRRTRWPARVDLAAGDRAGRHRADQRLRSRRQGHGDRDDAGSTWPSAETVGQSAPGGPRDRPGRRSGRHDALDDLFRTAARQGRAALVGYLPAGYPTVAGSSDLLPR